MKPLLLLLLLFINIKCEEPTDVYICNNNKTKKYHLSKTCRGLRNCTYQTLKITLEKAKKDGKTLCGYEKQP